MNERFGVLKFWCLFFASLKFIWGKGLGSHIRISWYENQMSDFRLETGTRGILCLPWLGYWDRFSEARFTGVTLRKLVMHRISFKELWGVHKSI